MLHQRLPIRGFEINGDTAFTGIEMSKDSTHAIDAAGVITDAGGFYLDDLGATVQQIT